MCELLIALRNNTHADPEKDRRGCYKRGMIVVIEDDGFAWGSKETLPDFGVVRITGVTKAQALELVNQQVEDDAGVPTFEADGVTPKIFRRRRWKALVDDIPSAIKNQLLNTGFVSVTKTQVRNYVKRQRDNATFDGLL